MYIIILGGISGISHFKTENNLKLLINIVVHTIIDTVQTTIIFIKKINIL